MLRSRRALSLLPALFVAIVACRSTPSSTGARPDPTSAPPSPSSKETMSTTPATPAPATVPTSDELATDARGERAFAAKLHVALAKSTSGNLFVSPASIRFAFAMLHAGAKGETATELGTLFGFTAKTHDVSATLARDWAKLAAPPKDEWRKGEVITISTANRLFAAKDAKLRPDYVDLTRDRYAAPVNTVDFAGDAEGARKAINGFVEQHTNGKIKDIVAPGVLSPATKLALANALYFRAAWSSPFDDAKPGPFTTPSGPVQAQMMSALGPGTYGQTGDAIVADLPYGSGQDFVMTIVLPKTPQGFAALEGSLDEAKLNAYAHAASHVPKLRITIPKFRVESTLSLADTLKALGAPRVFEYGKSDLSGIDGTHDLFIGAAIHKTFVAVDEKGTEAAAATVLGAIAGGPPPNDPPIEMKVDRPFLFAIRDVRHDRIVFLGRVVDPTR
jgi:serpin B